MRVAHPLRKIGAPRRIIGQPAERGFGDAAAGKEERRGGDPCGPPVDRHERDRSGDEAEHGDDKADELGVQAQTSRKARDARAVLFQAEAPLETRSAQAYALAMLSSEASALCGGGPTRSSRLRHSRARSATAARAFASVMSGPCSKRTRWM